MVQSTAEVLKERGTRYGIFMNQARIAQTFALAFETGRQLSGKDRFSFDLDELEALNMIFNKIARITNGDPHYSDSWRDIAGYATLVADRLDNDQKKLIEAKEEDDRTRTAENVEANRGCDEGCDCERKAEGSEPDSDNRPTGQPELRRLPVRLVVQDGNHITPTQTQPGVPGTPRQ